MDLSPSTPLLISAGFGYVLGTAPFGVLITRLTGGGDLRKIGSGNTGATNVLRTGNRAAAAATLALDMGKASLAVLAAQYVFARDQGLGAYAGLAACAGAVVGHCFPVWLRFRGGKGVAAFFGGMFAAMPPVGLACALAWLVTAFAFRFSSLAALAATAAAPAFAYVFHQGPTRVAFAAALALFIWIRHHQNIANLLSGKESQISLASHAPR